MKPNEISLQEIPRAAYVHVPFCSHHCGYCNFTVIAGRQDLTESFLRAIEQELQWLGAPHVVESLFIGGGTPTELGVADLTRLLTLLSRGFPTARQYEYSVEANPESFDAARIEALIAAERISDADVLRLLDYPSYFDLLNLPLPENREGILMGLEADRLIHRSDAGGWNITNLGAVLIAKRLSEFHTLGRKAVRVVTYVGRDRMETRKEQLGEKGYASGFQGLVTYINDQLPANEVVGKALRKTLPMFPELEENEIKYIAGSYPGIDTEMLLDIALINPRKGLNQMAGFTVKIGAPARLIAINPEVSGSPAGRVISALPEDVSLVSCGVDG